MNVQLLTPTMKPSERLRAIGIKLPLPPPPVANFVTYSQGGELVFLSGQGPTEVDGFRHTGKVGQDVTVDEAYRHARLTGINLLAVLDAALGSIDRVQQIVKVFGMVNAIPSFEDHPTVINGCSDLFIEIFGDKGPHSRSAVGMGSLPGNITVEIEAVVAVD